VTAEQKVRKGIATLERAALHLRNHSGVVHRWTQLPENATVLTCYEAGLADKVITDLILKLYADLKAVIANLRAA
jgi:hypothetical protein